MAACRNTPSQEKLPSWVQNYRHISRISIPYKVLQPIARDAITMRFRRQHLLHGAQYDFMTRHNCLMNLLSMLKMITQPMENENDVNICCLDFSKAFNFENRRFISLELAALGYRPQWLAGSGAFWQIARSKYTFTMSFLQWRSPRHFNWVTTIYCY